MQRLKFRRVLIAFFVFLLVLPLVRSVCPHSRKRRKKKGQKKKHGFGGKTTKTGDDRHLHGGLARGGVYQPISPRWRGVLAAAAGVCGVPANRGVGGAHARRVGPRAVAARARRDHRSARVGARATSSQPRRGPAARALGCGSRILTHARPQWRVSRGRVAPVLPGRALAHAALVGTDDEVSDGW
jgi:hypothetical protein